MMNDILFDLIKREIVLVGSGVTGDFETTDNPSVQNGGILLYSSCPNPLSPMFGIGITRIIGGDGADLAQQANRWQAQAQLDGASIADWQTKSNGGNDGNILTNISYE